MNFLIGLAERLAVAVVGKTLSEVRLSIFQWYALWKAKQLGAAEERNRVAAENAAAAREVEAVKSEADQVLIDRKIDNLKDRLKEHDV